MKRVEFLENCLKNRNKEANEAQEKIEKALKLLYELKSNAPDEKALDKLIEILEKEGEQYDKNRIYEFTQPIRLGTNWIFI